VRPHDCELANESPEHHLLKLELATAARAAGFRAELEVGNEARTWRADVLVFDRQNRPFMALEAQLSPMTPQDARMRAAGSAVGGPGAQQLADPGEHASRNGPCLAGQAWAADWPAQGRHRRGPTEERWGHSTGQRGQPSFWHAAGAG
jgi:competence protein CoiA